MTSRQNINSVNLIEEVKKRPCLYDSRGAHGNHELKNAAWGEIGQKMFIEKWHELSLADKDALVKDMQVKWKSLRDNFSRQLRMQELAKAGLIPSAGRKYIFMDKLSFLTPFINKRDKVVLSEDSKDGNDSMFVVEDTKPIANINSSTEVMDVSTSQPQLHFVPIQPKGFAAATLTQIDMNTLNNSGISFTGDQESSALKKVGKCLDELVSMQKEDKSDDPMGNKKFLLSLLPFMKKLPDDVNLEVRLQLMSVLETYSIGKSPHNP